MALTRPPSHPRIRSHKGFVPEGRGVGMPVLLFWDEVLMEDFR